MIDSASTVYAELWASLATLFRSYTAAHGLQRDRRADIEADEEWIIARHGDIWLELRRSGASVIWTRENGDSGVFEMTEHGTLRGLAGEEELDMAAEAWARELMQ